MEKEFIAYEQALALKELGFDELCFARYGNDSKMLYKDYSKEFHSNYLTACPTFSQVFRWFREKYLLYFEITLLGSGWEANIIEITERLVYFKGGVYKTYEEAENICLQKSIELLKNQELKWKKN